MKTLRVDVWSDIACPWCYVGKRRFEAAVNAFSTHRVEVRWRAFELDPAAPVQAEPLVPYAQRLARKYGTSLARAETMIERMAETGAAEGIELCFERVRPTKTFAAHQVLQLARRYGLQGAVSERLFKAYFSEGALLSDQNTLIRLGAEAGLEAEEVSAALASDAFAAEVRADQEEAGARGITGVPFFAVAGKYAISGAQPAELILRVLDQASEELEEKPVVSESDANACLAGHCLT